MSDAFAQLRLRLLDFLRKDPWLHWPRWSLVYPGKSAIDYRDHAHRSPIGFILHVKDKGMLATVARELEGDLQSGWPGHLPECLSHHFQDGFLKISRRSHLEQKCCCPNPSQTVAPDIWIVKPESLSVPCIHTRTHRRNITPLARIFHTPIEERSGGGVRRLEFTEPNETATHRFFCDRLSKEQPLLFQDLAQEKSSPIFPAALSPATAACSLFQPQEICSLIVTVLPENV
jgi:hypothetical protein